MRKFKYQIEYKLSNDWELKLSRMWTIPYLYRQSLE